MGPEATLAAVDLRAVMVAYRDVLRLHQERVNRLNVYPVPDGDTGTNMALTVEAVVTELGRTPDDAPMTAICKAMAHGSLMGARGNSGVILSQLLRGIAERLSKEDAVDGPGLAEALVSASDLARQAVVRPVEGTILTVARAAGEGAMAVCAENGRHPDLGPSVDGVLAVAEGARRAAADALEHTPELLPVLARAGVVDAGGAGYLLLFDALLHALDGREFPQPPPDAARLDGARVPAEHGTAADAIHDAHGEEGVDELRYEVMYLLDAPDDSIDAFREAWAGIGGSIVVVGGDGLYNCHIHTNDIGAAVEAALDVGRPRSIRVTDLDEQVQEERWVREGAASAVGAPPVTGPVPTTAVVAVVTGEGIGRIFRSLGVHHEVVGGQSMNPSTAQILEVVESIASDHVVVLPNNKNIRPVAEQVDGLTGKTVRVVPTGSIVEGFAALLAYDPAADAETNAAAMARSAQRVVPAEVTRAVRDAETEAGPVKVGDFMGLSRDGVVAIADTVVGATCTLLHLLLTEEHELVTIIEGEGSTAGDTRRITEWLHDEYPGLADEVHHGGQPLYPYLIGIE